VTTELGDQLRGVRARQGVDVRVKAQQCQRSEADERQSPRSAKCGHDKGIASDDGYNYSDRRLVLLRHKFLRCDRAGIAL